MADWTNIPDTTLESGAPAKGRDIRFLRDNPIAIAEGAPGAPRIVNAAVTNGTLGAEKFQTGTDERDWVLARTSGASVGAVGTYAWLNTISTNQDNASPGSTFPGSSLEYSSFFIDDNTLMDQARGSSPPGTWRLMGQFKRGLTVRRASMFLRIS